ncbi:ABC transporter permease [Oryzibacter oryziterrae]|uniref:ABC transporter permease n=1 Tax=Oryzibacter oryziterrae TaxID=2766474 RepID=UPI001F3FB285|nr:ABC transporter permease [Oryzibacter oryziterrae]
MTELKAKPEAKRSLPTIVWPLLALAVMLVIDGIINPSFFSIRLVEGRLYGSLIDILYRGTPIALIAMGMAIVIGSRGIDLSVGSVVAISGAVMAHYIHADWNPWLIVLVTLGMGAFCGLWNGALVSLLGIQPIIATLILMVAGRGFALMINGPGIPTFRSEFFESLSTGQFLTIPTRLYLVVLVFVILWALLRKTAFGLFVEAVGSNASASRLAGVGTRVITIAAYAIIGVCSATAGIIITGDVRASDAVTSGLYTELDAILAVVLGGASLNGGRIYLANTLVGVLIIQSLTTSILMSGLPPEYNLVVKAIVILVVLLVQAPKLRSSIAVLFGSRGGKVKS